MVEAKSGLSAAQVVDMYFPEHRAKLVDLAAFLDRVDRAGNEGADDFRVAALRQGMALLLDGQGQRTRRVLELLSDPTLEPIEKAQGQGAAGAWKK